jgi:hypothetical protein
MGGAPPAFPGKPRRQERPKAALDIPSKEVNQGEMG